MALALTVTSRWHDGKRTHVVGTVAASGNYATNGDTLDLCEGLSAEPPVHVALEGKGVYAYQYKDGTYSTDGKVVVRDLSADAAEIAQAAYPDGVKNDTIQLHAIFNSLQ